MSRVSDPSSSRTKVLVITVSYKTAELVCKSLHALQAERALHSELDIRAFVVDNASGDAPAIAQCIEEAHYTDWATLYEAPKNGGFSYGNNLGFRHAHESGFSPEYFLLLNPDAAVQADAISTLVQFLDEHPKAAVAGSLLLFPDGRPWRYAFRFPSIWSEINEGMNWGFATKLLQRWVVGKPMSEHAERVEWLPGASMLVRSRAIEELGGLDEAYFLYFEELDFLLKLHRAGWETWYVPESRVTHVAGASSGITGERAPRALPDYWFESRRRFFAKNHGIPYAMATDVAAVTAQLLGRTKRLIQGNQRLNIPGFVGGLLRNSILRSRNRSVEPPLEYWPTGTERHRP